MKIIRFYKYLFADAVSAVIRSTPPVMKRVVCRAPPGELAWNRQDPKSIWYLTDGGMVGFRVVRPIRIPDVITMHRLWNFSKGEP